MSREVRIDGVDAARWRQVALVVGVCAMIVCSLAAVWLPTAFLRAYLAAYMLFLGLGLGSMVLLMIYHLTGGSWGFVLRRIFEAGMRTLPLLAVFFVPIALGLKHLYPWAQPALVAASPKLQYQQFYLAPKWFLLRAVLYFVLWLTMAAVLGAWSRKQDATGDSRLAWKSMKFSGIAAVIYGISIHFAGVDWVMSLQPVFHSTIFGPLVAIGQLLSAFSLAVIVLAILELRPPLAEVVSFNVRNDLGSLLFTLLVLWAYLAWFQYMLIWIANMRVDVIWQVPRTAGGWLWVTWAIVVFHFVVPFFFLLSRAVKRHAGHLAKVAGLILGMQLVFDYYLVLPNFADGQILDHWLDFVTPLAIGGIWLAYYLWQLERRPLVAVNDYNFAAAMRLRELDAEEAAHEQEALAHE